MSYISLLFSILFILASLLSIYWGTHIIQLNTKSRINQVFLLLSIALSVWSFGFGMANSTNSLEMALFWRRFASVGMISLYGFVLHFFLLLTRQDQKNKLNKAIYLLYIPVIILTYIFTFSSNWVPIQYNLIQTEYGLTNIAANSIWNYVYYTYFSLYMFLSLGIVWKWKNKIKGAVRTRQARIIIGATFISGILATVTDIVTTTFMDDPLPQIAPLFILMPVWSMYYSAKHYGMMNLSKTFHEEIIVTEEDKKKIFNNLSIAIYVGAILAFVSQYLPYINEPNAFKNAFLNGLTIASIGIAINMVQNVKSESLREKLTIVVLVVSVPLVILQYAKYGSITVWVFPIIIIISSIIFSRLVLLISTTIAAVGTQVFLWITNPELVVVVDMYDYLLRIGIFLVAFLIGLYINRLYVEKIKENQYQIAVQNLVSEILFDFVNINEKNFNHQVNHLLKRIGEFFDVDRTYLFTIDQENHTMTYSNEWCNTEIEEELGTIKNISLNTFPWWIDQLKKKGLVHIEDVDSMPIAASEEQKQLHRQGVQSLVSVSVVGQEGMLAFIGIDSVKSQRKWTEKNIEMLNVMAGILYGGMVKIQADKDIEFMAYYDDLTKLPNRTLFSDRVKQAIYRSERTNNNLGVLFIDLDNFKAVNDTMGHKGGDELLKKVSQRLSTKVRKSDTVARFGGDEFMILIDNLADYQAITKISNKLMNVFEDLFVVEGQEFSVTASGGLALYPMDGENTDTLVKNADIAMYEAKAKGKNQYVLCTKEIKNEVVQNTELLSDLIHAIENDELVVHYQPQIDLNTKNIVGVEALVRWMHPTRGMIPPNVFIPIAEKNNLINSLGTWVLRTAATQNKKWQDMGFSHMLMAVNLSAVEMGHPKIVETIEDTIKETDLNPKYIELEITEGITIEETNYVVNLLNQLKKIGVSIAIDDFGTDYSSLNRLKLLPIDRIKIDKQFVQGIDRNEKDRAITATIINLGKSLGLKVLAEGVETALQLDFLNQQKCDYTQGFYHYKPMSADELEKLLPKATQKK